MTREVGFTEKDAPLRDDVRTLGALVGSVIREQGGDALFERVEAARVAAIRRRESGDSAEADLHAIVSGLAPRDAADLVQGFLAYFEVVNLAERVHRIRRRRDHLRESAGAAGAPPQEEGLEDAWRRLAARGLGPSEIARLLGRLRFEPVFTAHPTEATRRTLLEKQQTIGRLLVRRLDPSRTPDEERATLGRIRDEITIAWQTEAQRAERPTVLDELHHVLFFLTDVVYRVVPAFYEEVEETLAGVFGPVVAGIPVPPVLRFASWVGGDMDGNPNAGADTIRAALARHRALVLERYQREALELSNRLTQSATRISVDDAVVRRAADYAASFPEAFEAIPPRYRTMPYRLLLRLVAARLAATGRDDPHGYPSAAEFAADMETVRGSLARHGGAHAGLFSVRRLLRRVETFGFHLAALDARQDAFTHRAVMGRLLGDAGWLERSSAERAARLSRALSARDPLPPMNDPAAERTVAVFRALAEGRARYGADALGPYVVSMAQGEDDVLTVLLLAQWSGLGAADSIPLDVAPLFETDADLAAAPRVLAALLADPWYRRHVERRGHQIVMIGYSDSNKEIGIAASRWALQRAQVAIAAALDPTGIDLTIFHGRGGSVSRGGGKVAGGVLAAPPGTVRGRLRVTVQGEAITASYGLRGIALRTLEQAVSAVALATALPPPADDRTPRWHTLMDEIAAASHAAYRALVYDDPRFVEYFRLATPIDVIERMPIGSRPPARTPGTGLAQLRAIPWVFAWTQSRHVLPGWYGVGTALEGAVRRHGEATVAEMIRDWAFMKTLVDDVEMVLAKADIGIAARYAHLAGALEGSYFPGIRAEFERTVSWVLRLKGTSALLDEDPALQRSIRLRNPYVDPMSLLQVELLVRWRAAGRPDDDLLQALLATVRGIAQGLQNTG